jgi:hypothetical protein
MTDGYLGMVQRRARWVKRHAKEAQDHFETAEAAVHSC